MNTAEQTTPLVDDKEVDPFLCHLYLSGEKIAFCGVRNVDDAHNLMHRGYKQESPEFSFKRGPGLACPQCGATICEVCLRQAKEQW